MISAETIFEIDNPCIIDVRSENEFRDGTIFNAINIPILSNKEREEVGYTYVNKSIYEAKKLGLKYAGCKLENIFEKISEEFSQNKNIILFCARGGMRSLSLHNLLNSIGIRNYKLDRGYKGYRKFLRDRFPEMLNRINFIVIHGKTGIGKTKILNALSEEGYPIVDLECAANHRASFLGGVNLGEQNSQKQFETIVFHKLMDILKDPRFYDREKINVFIEGESKRIGKIIIPEYIFDSMNKGVHIRVDVPVEIRIKNLMQDYFQVREESFKTERYSVDKEILNDFQSGINNISRYCSKNEFESYMCLFNQKKYFELANELIKNYYDPKYLKSMSKHEFKFKLSVSSMNQFLNEMKNIYENLLF